MLKTCPNCGKWFQTRDSKKKFCSMQCLREWRMKHAKRDPASKRARRKRLVERYVDGLISREEFLQQQEEYKRWGLWPDEDE